MAFCLPKFAAEVLRKKLVSRELTPENLSEMTSEGRRTALSFLGEENAKQVNALFEGKLLLKNQQTAMINWAKQVLRMKPDVMRDTLSKVEKMTEVLTPKELDKFLEDIVEKKLGIDINAKEAGQLVDLANTVKQKKVAVDAMQKDPTYKDRFNSGKETPQEIQTRTEYGLSLQTFKDFVSNFKPVDSTTLGGLTKSMVASVDNSFWGNQGIVALLDPLKSGIWAKNFIKSLGDLGKALKGEDPIKAVKADIYSRPNALNGNYTRGKVALGLATEEAYPTALPERIPLLGRLFKASSAAYNGAALRLRADLFDRELALAEKNGIDITDSTQIEPLGKMINSQTGRGEIGASGKVLNEYFFSPRLLKATFDTLTANLLNKDIGAKKVTDVFRGKFTNPYALKQSAYTLMRITGTVLAVQAIANVLNPGSAETDPRGAHWGQIKVGDHTYISIAGPFRPLLRTVARLFPTYHDGRLGFWQKDANGKWRDLSDGKFGGTTPLDIAEQFVEGKASPVFGTLLTVWRGKDYNFNKPTITSSAVNLLTPMTIKNLWEGQSDPNTENAFLNTIVNAVGFQETTYK